MAVHQTPKITAVVPQLLVDDLSRAIAYYRDRLGFEPDFVYDGFYASVSRDGFAIHLKMPPAHEGERAFRKQDEHLDAYIAVTGVKELFAELQARGAAVVRTLEEMPWACIEFIVGDPDGHLLCFSELTTPSTSLVSASRAQRP